MNSSRTTVLVLWLSCISLSATLTASTICRNALYLSAFIALIDLFLKRPPLKWNTGFVVVLLTLTLSVSLYISTWLHSSVTFFRIDENYTESAKRLLLGSIITFYLILNRDKISTKGWLGAHLWVAIGFIYTVIIAIKLSSPDIRLEINTVATMTAYVFIVLSLATMFGALKTSGWIKFLSVISIIAMTSYVLVLTQTRSVLLTYPLLVLALLLKEKFFTKRSLSLFLIIFVTATIFSMPQINKAVERIAHSATEYESYKNNNDNTSLGARFSMWKAGFAAISSKPLGESADQRDIIARNYIINHENSNPEAIRAIKNHYHNDLLEAITLRGWLGFIILLSFYIGTIVASRKFTGTYSTTLLLIAPTVIYGSMDTLFIDHRYVTILVLLLPFYLCSEARKDPTRCTTARYN